MLFGIPESKDAVGGGAYDENGIVQQALREIRKSVEELILVGDVCLCEYTDHGHCGVIRDGVVENDASLELLAKTALSQVRAGADMVAPSDMMDGRVGAIRSKLDGAPTRSHPDHVLRRPSTVRPSMAPSVKPRVPRRSSVTGAVTRWTLRTSGRHFGKLRWISKRGADIVMVKPAMAYLDVIHRARNAFKRAHRSVSSER